jgi:putative glutamine amidotransferase
VVKIGITCSDPSDAGGGVHPDVLPYVDAVRRAGAEAVVLSNQSPIDDVLAAIDGLILSGGADVDPARYGGRLEHARAQVDKYRADRDDFEFALVRATRARGVPTLCICRGVQAANVAFGGTLIEDVREEFGERYTIHHRQTYENGLDRADHAPGHEVRLEPSSAVARICGAESFATNSMHHQALRDLGDGLVAAGRTSDGVIEAVDATFEHPFFLGMQWHPEELDDDPSRRLFAGLVAAARLIPPAPSAG